MMQWTDVDLTVKLKSGNLTGAAGLVAVIAQDGAERIETEDVTVLSADTLGVHLTQEETGRLRTGVTTHLFVNWTGPDGRKGIRKAALTVEENHPGRTLEKPAAE